MQIGLSLGEMRHLQGNSWEQFVSAFGSKFSRGTSAYRGVSLDKCSKRWTAYIRNQRKNVNLGSFDTEEDAAHAYDNAARRFHGRYKLSGTAFPSVAQLPSLPCYTAFKPVHKQRYKACCNHPIGGYITVHHSKLVDLTTLLLS